MADDPIAVSIASPNPIPVTLAPGSSAGASPPNTTEEQDRQTASVRLAARTAPPQTTEEQDRVSAGQRHINVKWETTQQWISLSVTWVVLVVCAWIIFYGTTELKLLAFTLLSNTFFLVVGTYFQRTNHTKSGGIGGDTAGPR